MTAGPTRTHVRLPGRGRAIGRAVAAGTALLTVIAGVPWLLSAIAGNPLPHTLPTWQTTRTALLTRDDGQLFLAALTDLTWACWGLFTLLVVIETTAQLRGRPTPAIRGLGVAQWLARVLVTAITAVILTGPVLNRVAAAEPPLPAATVAAGSMRTPPATRKPAEPAQPMPAVHTVAPVAQRHGDAADEPVTYVVKPRDTLWGIAARLLGDGERYQEIATLNYGRPQPDGRTLTQDHWIQPGWRLVLPAAARTGDPSTRTPRHPWYVVQPHDTLTSIAARELGSPDRYAELVRLNRDRRQPDGQRLTDPDLIRPGWRLLLPRENHTGSKDHDGRRPPHRDDRRHRTPSTAPTPPATTTPSARATTSDTPSSASAHPHGARAALDLPSGAAIGASLATAVGAAIATARLQRRRRYRPGEKSTPREEPPLSPSLRRLRRHATSDHEGQASPTVPSRGSPYEYVLASRDGQEIIVDLVSTNGLGLQGPGADDAARAVLVALLAATDQVEVVTTEQTLQLLCGVESVGDIPTPTTLTITPTLTAALEHLEAELIHRTRLLDSYDSYDVDTLRRDHPDELLPTIALVATDTSNAERRLDAVLTLGRPRAVTAVLLGPWHPGTTCHIDDDGTVTHAAGPGSNPLQNGRLFHLPHTDTTDLLAVLTAARGGPDRTGEHPTADTEEPAASFATTRASAGSDAPVHLSVLGPVNVRVGDSEIATGLRSRAREVLAYLATRPDGATLDQTLAALWPDTDPERAAAQFRAAVGNIRKALRDATGTREARFVLYTDQRYRLDPQLVDVDLWRFHAQVQQSQDGNDRQAALERAVHAYVGDFADGRTYEWAEPLRESLRRRALDAYTRLAETQKHHGELDHAVTTLDRALDHDPYNEQLYQRSFRLLHQLGRADAVRRLYRQLQNRLADLDVDPEPATEQLVAEFLNTRRTSR